MAADVASAEFAIDRSEGEADAIAIAQRRRWVQLKFGKREVGGLEQSVEPCRFLGELRGV
jgi:hypothetical protein